MAAMAARSSSWPMSPRTRCWISPGKHHWKARRGGMGLGKKMAGEDGEDLLIRVPCGTLIYDLDHGILLADLDEPGKQIVVAKAGQGRPGQCPLQELDQSGAAVCRAGRVWAGAQAQAGAEADRGCRAGGHAQCRQEHAAAGDLGRPAEGGGLSVHDAGPAAWDCGTGLRSGGWCLRIFPG